MIEYSDVRYLIAKTTVDDRALNRTVLDQLRSELSGRGGSALRVLELGAGTGTLLPRLSRWGILPGAQYTLLDRDPDALQAAREHLLKAGTTTATAGGGLRLQLPTGFFDVQFVQQDALDYLAANPARYELILANAVLDLMHLESALPKILAGLVPGGAYHFSINFDGDTIFLPELPLDDLVMRLYHRTMDERVRDGLPCGDSKCGRHLLELLPRAGAKLLGAGSSDWIVFAQAGAYAADEAYFLHHIVNTIELALQGSTELDASAFTRWVAERHAQVEQGRLIYIAHQLDVVGRGR